jgi:hypothetical protein
LKDEEQRYNVAQPLRANKRVFYPCYEGRRHPSLTFLYEAMNP